MYSSISKRLEEVMHSASEETSDEGSDKQPARQVFRIQSKASKDFDARPERVGIPSTLRYKMESFLTPG